MAQLTVEIYTDGSCHTIRKTGAWAAIIICGSERKIISDVVENTTNNRMEITAVIKAIEYSAGKYHNAQLIIYSDSQYVTRLTDRKEKLKANSFTTRKGTDITNIDLVYAFLELTEIYNPQFVKVKAHQKPTGDTINYNRQVDMLARQLVRNNVNE